MSPYEEIQKNLARGWNTWDTHSVLTHVYLPSGFAIRLSIKDRNDGSYLEHALIGRKRPGEETVYPLAHAYDGSYTELNLTWKNVNVTIASAAEGDEFVLLVSPAVGSGTSATLVAEAGILWNRPGFVERREDRIVAMLPDGEIPFFSATALSDETELPALSPHYAADLSHEAGFSAGSRKTLKEIREMLASCRERHELGKQKYGPHAEAYNAMQTVLAWDTIYEPSMGRVVTPVSRMWNVGWGGYVLFCWDTYFAAYMASVDNRELAYANAVEITREKTSDGFVPNFASSGGRKSWDRSQPPVGSLVVREIYRRYGEKWFLKEVFDTLYEWNSWFLNNRQIQEGLMAWGSNPYDPSRLPSWNMDGVNDTFGGALESGLDNSPMYDSAGFDHDRHMMTLADAGLTALYAMDCAALADIADALSRQQEKEILLGRHATAVKAVRSLWDESAGIFKNLDTATGSFSPRLSPTNFYPMLAGSATPAQAETMVNQHLLNPEEFWGEWVIPSISRNDPAYPDNEYWRGRVWAPMNLLVYLGLRQYPLEDARKRFAEKSERLLLKEWLEHGHVHENYNADSGVGCDVESSDRFYHWGALLSLIALMENGFLDGLNGK